ncbi:MAG: sulfite exporter TauE/SafE family protein [Myxococcales bacterium]|nr:sulfite exporter TauE/SafE family protein [Myxococcales bacterium]
MITAGIAAGVLNVMAGGGSMFTLPVLILLGLPASVANGTNRVAVLMQSISGVYAFQRSGKLDSKAILPVLLPTSLGALGGSLLASRLPETLLKPILLGTMIAMAALLALRPKAISAPDDAEARSALSTGGFVGLFVAGLYGGFIQAGVGFILLSVFGGILRYDLVRANALKLTCTAIFGAVALVVFIQAGQVVWVPGLILAAASVAGSIIGVRIAVRIPQSAIRWVVFGAVLLSCIGAYFK